MLLRFSLAITKDAEIGMTQPLDRHLVHLLMKPPPVGAHDLTGRHHQKEIATDLQPKKLKQQQRKLDGLMKKKLKSALVLAGGKNKKRKKNLLEKPTFHQTNQDRPVRNLGRLVFYPVLRKLLKVFSFHCKLRNGCGPDVDRT